MIPQALYCIDIDMFVTGHHDDWLLLLLLVVSSQSVDSRPNCQSTTDDEASDGEQPIGMKEMLQKILNNQRQQRDMLMNRKS